MASGVEESRTGAVASTQVGRISGELSLISPFSAPERVKEERGFGALQESVACLEPNAKTVSLRNRLWSSRLRRNNLTSPVGDSQSSCCL